MTSRRQDFLSTAVEQLRYHVQKLESAATHMMAACVSPPGINTELRPACFYVGPLRYDEGPRPSEFYETSCDY